jgi:predicted transcriptional regulator
MFYHQDPRVIRMSSRSRSEIVSHILDVASGGSGVVGDDNDGATMTEILYKVFLSDDQLKEYLMILTESDLLCYHAETHTYKPTEKGHMFLQAYNQIDQILKEQQI